MTKHDDDPDCIWVSADVDLDGTYRLTIQYTKDTAVTLDHTRAIAYATEIFTATAYATYDAAVVKQMTRKLGLDQQTAATVISGLRDDRPPLNQDALGLLHLTPGVSALTGAPFLHCSLTGHPLRWPWEPADAEQHATHVLQCYPAATLDNAYRQYLVGTVGLDQAGARAAVGDLAAWRSS